MADSCSDLLTSKLFNHLEVSDEHDFTSKLRRVLDYHYDDLKKIVESSDTAINISIPIAKGLLGIGGSHETSRDAYENLRVSLLQTLESDISDYSMLKIKKSMAIPRLLQTYEECIKTIYGHGGVRTKILGDKAKEFTLYISYTPISEQDANSYKIKYVELSSNLEKIGHNNLSEQVELQRYTALPQQIRRKDNAAATITVSLEGRADEIIVELDPVPPPPPLKPKPIPKSKSITISPGRSHTFVPPRTRGDADFDAHGDHPASFYVRAWLEIKDERNLYLRLNMHGEEPVDDYTTVDGSSPVEEPYRLFTADEGWRIVSISKPKTREDYLKFLTLPDCRY